MWDAAVKIWLKIHQNTPQILLYTHSGWRGMTVETSAAREVLQQLRDLGMGVFISCADCFMSVPLCAGCYLARKDVVTRMKCTPCKEKKKKEYKGSFSDRRNSADRSKRWRDKKKAEKEKADLVLHEQGSCSSEVHSDDSNSQCETLFKAPCSQNPPSSIPTNSPDVPTQSSPFPIVEPQDSFAQNKIDTEQTQVPQRLRR
jgi:hypothetical protein